MIEMAVYEIKFDLKWIEGNVLGVINNGIIGTPAHWVVRLPFSSSYSSFVYFLFLYFSDELILLNFLYVTIYFIFG